MLKKFGSKLAQINIIIELLSQPTKCFKIRILSDFNGKMFLGFPEPKVLEHVHCIYVPKEIEKSIFLTRY